MISRQPPQQGSGVLQNIPAGSEHGCKEKACVQHWNALWALIPLSFVSEGQYAETLAVCVGDCFLCPWQELSWLSLVQD